MFNQVEFVTSVAELPCLPPADGREVAFVGRSNAGKSSALNAITGRRIAFVAKTPGRTQLINFFSVAPDAYLVDLPGYGYAAVPAAARAHWNELVGGYLESRASLHGIVMLMDIRHPLTPLDRELLAWITPSHKPLHILLSKADKLTRAHGAAALRKVSTALQDTPGPVTVQLFSSTAKTGIVEAADRIGAWLEVATKKTPGQRGPKTGGKP